MALCPTCHTRYDKGEIDRPAMRQYKANLSVVNSRYGDVEKRVLDRQVLKLSHYREPFGGGIPSCLQIVRASG